MFGKSVAQNREWNGSAFERSPTSDDDESQSNHTYTEWARISTLYTYIRILKTCIKHAVIGQWTVKYQCRFAKAKPTRPVIPRRILHIPLNMIRHQYVFGQKRSNSFRDPTIRPRDSFIRSPWPVLYNIIRMYVRVYVRMYANLAVTPLRSKNSPIYLQYTYIILRVILY